MSPETAYLVFGLALCAALAGIIVHSYRRGHRDRIESPKHRMLEDDDTP